MRMLNQEKSTNNSDQQPQLSEGQREDSHKIPDAMRMLNQEKSASSFSQGSADTNQQQQNQHQPIGAESTPDNHKPPPITHHDTPAAPPSPSPDTDNNPATPPPNRTDDQQQATELATGANQTPQKTATDTQPPEQGITDPQQDPPAEIHQRLQAPAAAPRSSQPEHSAAEQGEPATDLATDPAPDNDNTALPAGEQETNEGQPASPDPAQNEASQKNDIPSENDSEAREEAKGTEQVTNETNDDVAQARTNEQDQQATPESDPESSPPGPPNQSGQPNSEQGTQDDNLADTPEKPNHTPLPSDTDTRDKDTSEESGESNTENPLQQISEKTNTPTEDDTTPLEDKDTITQSGTDATSDESDPDSQLNDNLERPENPRDLARPQDQLDTCGDPIDVASGNVVMHQTDVELAGTLPLILTRTHVSSYQAGRSFGPSWASTLDQRLKIDDEGACYASADGMVLVYPPTAAGIPILPVEGPRWPLTRINTGTYTITDPQHGHTLHFTTTTPNNPILPLTAITDRNQHRIDLDRTPEGTLTQIRHSGGYRITVDTTHHRITALHLANPNTGSRQTLIRYTYNSNNHLTEVINSSGLPLRFTYDTHGRMTSWQDRNDTQYRYTYNIHGRCIHTTGPNGYMNATLTYDLDNRTTIVTNSLGHVTTYHLNHLGQLTHHIDPLSGVTASEWDRYDRLLTRTDPLGRATRYTYDHTGNLVEIIRPDGSHTTATYNNLQQPTRITDYDGAIWQRDYDLQGNLTTITNPLGATTTYAYDQQGHLTTTTDALGNTHHIDTNPTGLPITIINPDAATTRFTRDRFGRITTITDPVGGTTRLGWTVEGKLAWRILPDGATERWAYDGEGNLAEHLNPAGYLTRTHYTHFDLPAVQTSPDEARLEFGYDTELHLTTVTNPQGSVWRYDYDPTGNLTREIDFNGRVLTYTHDAAGQLTQRTNGINQTTHYTRDLLGNIIEQRSIDTIATFSYDPVGRVVGATNADANLILHRDLLGQVIAETCNGRTLTSTYDPVGCRTHRRTPTGAESTWEYNTNGQPITLHTTGHTLHFNYDPAGREIERCLGIDVMLAQTWDANHQLRSQTITAGATVPGQSESARQTRLIQHRTYTYRPDGYPTSINDHLTGTRRFKLDPTGRITTVHGSGWTEQYAYDPAGNITHATWPTPPQANLADADTQGWREYSGTLIRRAGNIHYHHDTQGRIIMRQHKHLSAKPQTWHYTWNSDDRLIAVTTPDRQHWRYHYDPLGRRITKQCLGDDETSVLEKVDFTWDRAVLAEQTHTNYQPEDSNAVYSRTTSWEWEPGTFRLISQTERVPLRDAPQEWVDEQFYAIVADLVGTPTEMVNSEGTIAWHPRTTLWGLTFFPGPSSVKCPLRFPGQYHDSETQLHYNYFRYYDSTTGCYQTGDPIGLRGGNNPHMYVHNPFYFIDPLGQAPCGTWVDSGGVVRSVDDVPSIIWREGELNPSNVRRGPDSLSFRDSLSNPVPTPEGMQPVFRREAYAIDTSQLPPGSVRPDGAFGSKTTPPGHVTVNLASDAKEAAKILKLAEISILRQKFPR